jgi:hypothetical protein
MESIDLQVIDQRIEIVGAGSWLRAGRIGH